MEENKIKVWSMSLSVLEGEMYQLSSMLTEQKSLMSSMMELPLVSDKGQHTTTVYSAFPLLVMVGGAACWWTEKYVND